MARPVPGQILLLYCDWLGKSKYFVLVGIENKDSEEIPLLLFISTNKLKIAAGNPSIDADFLGLRREEYIFLDYDSWLDCGDVCARFNWQTIEYQIQQCVGKICGRLLLTTRDAIVAAVGNSERLSTRHQLLICDGLAQLK